MKRFLKQYFNRYLPNSIRGLIKRRMTARFAARVTASMEVAEEGPHLRCTIEGASFLAPKECSGDLIHFTETLDGRAEFYSIARAATKGGTFFDIGANTGLMSAMFCALNSRNSVYSFEPSSVLITQLATIRDLNGFGDRMRLEQIGIGACSETREMILDPAGGFIQSQRFEHTMWAPPETVQIRLENLGDAATRLGVVPDYIKLDIESFEYEAISGATDFLARHKPTIFLELHLNYLQQRKLPPEATLDMLMRCGYAFYTSGGAPVASRQIADFPLSTVHVIAR